MALEYKFPPIPRLIRHNLSGVWIGYVIGRGILDPENSIMFRGRRVWSWSGGRLECSELAKLGARSEDRLGPVSEVEIQIAPGSQFVEAVTMDPETVERTLSL